MGTFLAFAGLGLSFAMIKYREYIGDAIGQADWMLKVGGVYNVIVFCGILMFFWCLAFLTGTQEIFLGPFLKLVGGAPKAPVAPAEVF